jgi:two-component SAPR family response regulator
VLLIEAYAYLQQNDQATCHERLREAFAIGRSQHYFGSIYCWFPKSMMSRLCAEALRAEIEIDHVRQLIKRRGLFPEDPTIDCWPWPVRVYTLGQFKLVVEDQTHVLETKGQHKPLRLLEVLIALGGTEVKEQRISEILWPDAEGDAAHSAFTTTLSRLRKLIGDETIIVRNGRVSLDEQRCWVDASALERHLDRADEAGSDSERTAGPVEKFMALYQGPFLRDEDQEWPRRLRNRLRAKLSRFLMRCGRNLSAAGEAEQAVHLFEQALEIDPSAEDFYRGLIAIYAGSGQNTEALVTYARCREILFRDFGTAPSQELEALFRNIESRHFPVTEQGQATH